MAGALKGPPLPDAVSVEARLQLALRELSVTRASLQQATACLHQLTHEVTLLLREKREAERALEWERCRHAG